MHSHANRRASDSTVTMPISSPSRRQKNNKKEASMTCDKCGNTLIVADWSEYVNDGLVLDFWSCWKCGNRFETEAYMSADAESEIESKVVVREFFPSLLVA
jgi:ribosomal protein L37AE/L43A